MTGNVAKTEAATAEATPVAPSEQTSPVVAPPRHSIVRRFVETAILFVTLIMIVRAVALEPFGVPTGSMAQTLVGNHKACTCPRCGYPVFVGSANGTGKPLRDPFRQARCPNCDETKLNLHAVRECVGDRLLVDKNVYELRKPRRWEVAVFRCPSDDNKPYVKRIVGLPGESVLLQDGDVFVNRVLQRKSLAECRAVRVPIFDNNFQPTGGWGIRWRNGRGDFTAFDPAQSATLHEADEALDGTQLRLASDQGWLIYRHWLLNENQEAALRDDFGYNGGGLPHPLNTVHDFFVEFDLETGPDAGSFIVGLRDGNDDVWIEMPVGGAQKSTLRDRHGKTLTIADVRLEPSRRQRIEFALFDRRVLLAIDGREACAAYDLPVVRNRDPVSRPCWMAGKGASFTVRNFRLFRDIHYSATGGECRNGVYEPWPLGPEEYFLLGDNSANSQDSRFWTNAGIPERCFMGKPLLLHQPSHWTHVRNWEIECIDWNRIRWIR